VARAATGRIDPRSRSFGVLLLEIRSQRGLVTHFRQESGGSHSQFIAKAINRGVRISERTVIILRLTGCH
jgi:hypothetical protein